VIDVLPSTPKLMQKDNQGKFLFTSDPDYCCYINKVLPMEPLLLENDVWINGVRADQSAVRKGFNIEEKAKHGVTRYHPMLDWNGRMISQYIRENNLPKHPLEDKGYLSIGCEPCTRLLTPEMAEREARWYGMNKTECGLNTDLVQK
jgi:phosphoadenosine phosphosulfate reductase